MYKTSYINYLLHMTTVCVCFVSLWSDICFEVVPMFGAESVGFKAEYCKRGARSEYCLFDEAWLHVVGLLEQHLA